MVAPSFTGFAPCDALLTDGEVVQLRELDPHTDGDELRRLYAEASDETHYLRWFTMGRRSAELHASRLLAGDDRPVSRGVLTAWHRGRLIGVGVWEPVPEPHTAEIAFFVDDDQHGHGVGTLLLEHLADWARHAGFTSFIAETLPVNRAMLGVFRDAGFAATTERVEGVVEIAFPVAPSAEVLAAADARESAADVSSLSRLLAPSSVAIVGVGRHGGLGRQIASNAIAGGYTGDLFLVGRGGGDVDGHAVVPSLSDLPGAVDVVVVAVPAAAVLDVARAAGALGAHGLVVITAGFAEDGPQGRDQQRELVRVCREHDMRLIGPNCMGFLNAAHRLRLNATFEPGLPPSGRVGMMSQSGAVGIATLAEARRTGLGVSTFISIGNKADVSGNDLLCWWENDEQTRVCALYLESFGNPRKFARIARRVSERKPIIAVKSGRSAAGAHAVASHTAAAAAPDIAVDALFAETGVIRANGLSDMFGIVMLADLAPLPHGRRVAVVGNSGGPEVMATDACATAGLETAELTDATRARIAAACPEGLAVRNPLDLLAEADPPRMVAAIEALLDAPEVDSVVVVYTRVGSASDAMLTAIADVAQGAAKPVLLVVVGEVEPAACLRDADGSVRLPVYPFPEPAVAALAHLIRYAAWRDRPLGTPAPLSVDALARVRALVDAQMEEHPEGGWVDGDVAARIVAAAGVPTDLVERVEGARSAERRTEGRGLFAIKGIGGDLVHKTERKAVVLGVEGGAAVGRAVGAMRRRLGQATPIGVQEMAPTGVEVVAGVVSDPTFGPLVLFGLGGVATELLADRQIRLAPLTREDAGTLVRSLRASPLLTGYRGNPPVDLDALEELLLAISGLADQVAEVAELDLNPVIARPDGVLAVDVKMRLAPVAGASPLRRSLR